MKFNILNNEDKQYLKSIIDCSRVYTDDEISEDYFHDEMSGTCARPDVVIFVNTAEEISLVMKYANKKKIPVTVRGTGTGLVGGCVAVNGGIIIVTKNLNKIIEIDKKNMTMTVEAGVLLSDTAKFAQENGFLYPPDPGEKTATIGGNINTNAGGMRAVKYGVTREYVRGLTVVLPNGEIIETGGKTAKNCSGYSIKDMIIGSEGTLGIVTKAVLKIIPLPQTSLSLLAPFDSEKDALNAAIEIHNSDLKPTAIEYMEKEVILYAEKYLGKAFPDTSSRAYLLFIFDGSKNEVNENSEDAAKLLLSLNAKDVFIADTDERKETIWTARGAFLEAIKNSTCQIDECDVVVPPQNIFNFLLYTKQLSLKYGIRIPAFGHAGDGNLHVYLCKDNIPQKQWEVKIKQLFNLMYKRAYELNGFVSGEHGIGYAKKEYYLQNTDKATIKLMRNIKKAFDKNNILNPDKIF